MVSKLREMDAIRSAPVAAALDVVPRHLFAPGEPLEAAYAPEGIVIAKRGPEGLPLSVMSAAHLQAVMLEQAGIEPGMRVLEVGSGGYNAALIQEITGDSGQVTTVDIDADITGRARGCLDAAGYDRVNVVLADAEGGVPAGAPYDRIIVTAAAWDIPLAWISQLTEQGTLIVPLRLRGLTRSIAPQYLTTGHRRDLHDLVRACGLGAGTAPEWLHDELMAAVDCAETSLRRELEHPHVQHHGDMGAPQATSEPVIAEGSGCGLADH